MSDSDTTAMEPVDGSTESAPAPAPVPASRGSQTRTIGEVIAGVVAVGLILLAGAVGFAVGHATGDHDGRRSMPSDSRGGLDHGDRGGPMGHDDGPMAGLPGAR